ncbi:MAG: hypothetical protein U5R46_11775 [Gammaproteobacteria bacterium]|nr:hypothetical protein [Gammaproteobacteria bacterium]
MRDVSDSAIRRGPRRYLLPLLTAILSLMLFSACSEAEGPAPQTVELDPEQAVKSGDARYKCWSGRCWWVVWCGHNVCDGSWQWTFPATGNYEIIWKGLNFKCAGAPPYELRINGDVVKSGVVDQYKSCEQCQRGSMAEVFRDTSLGEYSLEVGDEITLYAKNDFACGINGPGAYAAHDSVTAELRD